MSSDVVVVVDALTAPAAAACDLYHNSWLNAYHSPPCSLRTHCHVQPAVYFPLHHALPLLPKAGCWLVQAPQQQAGMALAAHVWVTDATWAVSSEQAGCKYPDSIASPLAHALQRGSGADFSSGHRDDAGLPWKPESFVKWVGQTEAGPQKRRRMAEAAVVHLEWACSGWRSE